MIIPSLILFAFFLTLVVKTTNLEAQTRMDTWVWFRYLLIYKGRTLLEALTIELTVL